MKKLIILLILLSTMSSLEVYAKARFMDLPELVAVSDAIAVIEVTKTDKTGIFGSLKPKKGYHKYSQKNVFNFIEYIKEPIIKISDSKNILYAEKDFICASASYSIGKYLVFLEYLGNSEWITINHDLGALQIKDNKVDFGWYTKKGEEEIEVDLAKEYIKQGLLSGKIKDLKIVSNESFFNLYNVWRDDWGYQKIVFNTQLNVESKDILWPEGLTYFASGYLKIDKTKYISLFLKGGKYTIDGNWKNGFLIINSINKETK